MVRVTWLLMFLASVGASREIQFKNCKSGTVNHCKVKSVKIYGCLSPSSWVDVDGSIVEYQEGNVKNPCRINYGTTLNFTINYEPGFSESSLRSQFTLPDLPNCWGSVANQDPLCPLDQAPDHACAHTKCPLRAGHPNRYEISLPLSSEAIIRPVNERRIYQMRWKLWNNKNKKHSCCFNIPIQY